MGPPVRPEPPVGVSFPVGCLLAREGDAARCCAATPMPGPDLELAAAEARIRGNPLHATRLVELLSALGWHVVVYRHPAGGLAAIGTRRLGEQIEASASTFDELAPRMFAAALASSRANDPGGLE